MKKKRFLERIQKEENNRDQKKRRAEEKIRERIERVNAGKTRVTITTDEDGPEMRISPPGAGSLLLRTNPLMLIPFIPLVVIMPAALLGVISKEMEISFPMLLFMFISMLAFAYYRFVKWRYPGLRLKIIEREHFALWVTGNNPDKPQYVGRKKDLFITLNNREQEILNSYETGERYLIINLPDDKTVINQVYSFSYNDSDVIRNFLIKNGVECS